MADSPTTNQLIADLWKRNRPLMLERLAQLDAVAASARAGTLSPADQAEAESTAHKLSGSLGMFGYQSGTECARALESELQTASPQAEMLAALAKRLRESVGLAD